MKNEYCLSNFEVHQNYRFILFCKTKIAGINTAITKQTSPAPPQPSPPWPAEPRHNPNVSRKRSIQCMRSCRMVSAFVFRSNNIRSESGCADEKGQSVALEGQLVALFRECKGGTRVLCARDRECAAERDRGHWLVCEKHHGLDAGE